MPLKSLNGLPIIDAKRPITLHVPKADLAKADRKEPADCVMARACRRELGVAEVRVHLSRVYIRQRNGKQWTRYSAPVKLRTERPVNNAERRRRGTRHPSKDKSWGGAKPNRKRRTHTSVPNVRIGPA